MFSSPLLLLLALTAALLTSASPTPLNFLPARKACDTGLHIIVARASTEAQGPGISGSLANSIAGKVSGSTVTSVVYPATLSDYTNSESSGVTAMKKLVTSYASACPQGRMVLIGYSQGAQVTGDVVCGSKQGSPLDAKTAGRVMAILQFGDPAHVQGLTGNVGSSNGKGMFPRANAQACAPLLQGKTQAYCDSGDTFCDSGNSLQTHLSYINKYSTAAQNFVVGLAGKDSATTQKVSVASADEALVATAEDVSVAAESYAE